MRSVDETRPIVRRFLLRVATLLALVGGAVFYYKVSGDRDAVEAATLQRARAHFRDIVLTRAWNASYGGVYVEKGAGVISNPYLKDPDIVATNGKVYTLRNPALMTREISGLAEKAGDYHFHITSLRLKNPANAPDPWEKKALESFALGDKEQFEYLNLGDHTEFRYMAPLFVERSCLGCHEDQGYRIGDVRGGISVRFDVTPLVASRQRDMLVLGVALLLASGLVFLLTRRFAARFDARLSGLLSRYDGLVQSVDGIVWEADANDCRFVFVSDRAERLLGFPLAEWREAGFWARHIHPDDRAWVIDRCASSASRREPCDFEYRFIARDGRVVWLRNLMNVVAENGTPRSLRGLMFDITPQKDLEQRLREVIKEQETTFQNALVGIIHLRRRTIVTCNRRLEQIFGYAPGELNGVSTAGLYKDAAAFERLSAEAGQALAKGDAYTGEIEMRHRDGSVFWGAVHGRAIDPANPGEGSIWVFADISERKRIESELRNYRQHLEDLVQQRTADLAAALDAARVADKTKDAFLANISHELRTPLNAVIGLSNIVLQASAEPRQRAMLEKIADSGQTLLAIINDLLDLTKITAGEMQFEHIPFSVRRVVNRVASAMSHRAAEKGLRLDVLFEESVPDVLLGDPLRVEQILTNLVANAVKFTEKGFVKVAVGGSDEGDGFLLQMSVEDSGIGMNAEEVDRLFKPFVQADASTTRRHGGTGLGLAICKRFAEAMDGNITVRSEPERGSSFSVSLRLKRSESALLAGVTDAREIRPRRYPGARVLVVDDQAINREIVQEQLATVGIEPNMAENGADALEAVRRAGPRGFDLVLMDIQMPVMDGLEATRKIRALPGMDTLPIVAMTAHTMNHEKQAYLAAGLNDHLGKPFAVGDFFALLARWLPAPPGTGNDAPPPGEANALVREEAAPGDSAPPPGVLDLADIPGLDAVTALARFQGNVARFRHWLAAFVEESANFFETLGSQLETRRTDEARRSVHAFKGRVGMLGMNELHRLAVATESAIHDERTVQPWLLLLAREIKMLRRVLASRLGVSVSPFPRGSLIQRPDEAMPDEVRGLIGLLDRSDGESVVAFESCCNRLDGTAWGKYLEDLMPLVLHAEINAVGGILREEDAPEEA